MLAQICTFANSLLWPFRQCLLFTRSLVLVLAVSMSGLAAAQMASTQAPVVQNGAQILNFRNADIRAFIEAVSRSTGFIFVVDPRVKGEVTVISSTAVPQDVLFEIFTATLQVNGVSAIGNGNGTYKLVPAEDAVFDAGVGGNGGPQGLQTRVFSLNNINANVALKSVQPLVGRRGRAVASTASNALIIVETAPNIARIQDVLSRVDADRQDWQSLALKNASAAELAEVVNDLSGSGDGGTSRNARAVAVPSSNSLILRGEPQMIAKAAQLVRDLDAASAASQDVAVLGLRNAAAADLLPVLQQVTNSIEGANPNRGAATASLAVHEPTNSLIINASPDTQRALAAVVRKLDVRRPQVLVEALIVEVSDDAARDLGVQFILSGNEGSNAPFAVSNYSNAAPNVLALTGAVLLDDELGADDQNVQNVQEAAVNSLLGLNGLTTGFLGETAGGTIFGFIVNAIDRDTASNILSTPSIMTLDNQPASIIVGQEIPITTGEALGAANLNPFRTIQRQDVGIQLEVRPQISEDDHIRLFIRQEVSSIFGTVNEASNELVTNKREIETTVLVDDGEVLVLGGLIEDDEQLRIERVPLVGSVPIFGRLFRSEGRVKSRTNLMVFIRPTIVRDSSRAEAVTGRKYDYIRAEQILRGGDNSSSLDDFLNGIIGAGSPEPNGSTTVP